MDYLINNLNLNITQHEWILIKLSYIYKNDFNNYNKVINIINNINYKLSRLQLGSFYILTKILKEYNNDNIIDNIIYCLDIIVNTNKRLHYYMSMLTHRDPIKYYNYFNYINKDYLDIDIKIKILQYIHIYDNDDICKFIIDILDIIKDYNNVNNSFNILFTMYKYNTPNKIIKINYIIKILKYINNIYFLDNNKLEYYTFDDIYNDICIYYNKNISLFKLSYIECKETNQEIYSQFIDKSI